MSDIHIRQVMVSDRVNFPIECEISRAVYRSITHIYCMLRHSDIWLAIDLLARRHGLTPSGLARKAGLDSTTFNKSKRETREGKKRWPSTGSIAKVLEATGSSLSEFLAPLLVETPQAQRKIPIAPLALARQVDRIDGTAQPIGSGWGETTIPGLADPAAFAVEIDSGDLEPAYQRGDIIFLSPAMPIEAGCRLLLKTRTGEILAMRLVRRDPNAIELSPCDGTEPRRMLALDSIHWMVRIVLMHQ